jgi:hypothetical protein
MSPQEGALTEDAMGREAVRSYQWPGMLASSVEPPKPFPVKKVIGAFARPLCLPMGLAGAWWY